MGTGHNECMNDIKPIRVGIVEDHVLFLDLLAASLNNVVDIEVVVTADRVAEAKKWFNPAELDVLILDIELPDGNGVGLGLTMRRQNPNLGVVLLSARDMLELFLGIPDEDRKSWSYLSKSATKSIEALAGVVRATSRGQSIIDPALVARNNARPQTGVSSLTSRQYEILRAVARGESNQTIAENLGIATNSVGNHLISIYAALGIPEGKNARVAAVLEFMADTAAANNIDRATFA